MQGLNIELISGMMIGVELFDDEEFSYFVMDLAIVRLVFFKEKKNDF